MGEKVLKIAGIIVNVISVGVSIAIGIRGEKIAKSSVNQIADACAVKTIEKLGVVEVLDPVELENSGIELVRRKEPKEE